MNIELDREAINGAIQEAVSKAIAQGVSNWQMAGEIARASEEAVRKADMPAIVGQALDERLSLEAGHLIGEAIEHAMPALRAAISHSASTMAASMLFGLRRGPDPYSDRDKILWKECLDLIHNGVQVQEVE